MRADLPPAGQSKRLTTPLSTPTIAADDIIDTVGERAEGAREPLLVIQPLREFLAASGLEGPSDLRATPIGDGHSNVTFALSTGVVLRRPPRGPLPPSAHDVLREARLLRALAPTAARIPAVLAVCEDPEVIGAPFYVMEQVQGEVVTTQLPEPLDNPSERARIADELVDGLVEVHDVEYRELGLEGFGKPTGYLQRQIRRFLGGWEHNRTRNLPEVEQVAQWLQSNMPESPPATIVHGDYRLGNTMLAPSAPARLITILDWEMATIGDPLADVGYMISHWTQADDEAGSFTFQGVTSLPGFPSRRELVARYEERSGRPVPALDWYVALALWKAIVFMEGNYKRAISGATDDPYLKSFGDEVPALARRAIAVTKNGF